MWDIIIWTDQNAIDFVPTSWRNEIGDLYKYPINLSENKTRQCVYDCNDLEDLQYRWCGATLIRGNVRSLEEAKDLCNKGYFTSSLETDSEDDEAIPVLGRKERKPRRLYEDSEDDNGIPKTIKKKIEDANLSTSIQKSKQPINDRQIFKIPTLPTKTCKLSCINNPSNHQLDSFSKNNVSDSKPDDKSKYSKVRNVIRQPEKNQNQNNTTESDADDNDFIEELESIIKNSASQREELISLLYLIGGDTVKRSVNLIMKKLLNNETAIYYSGVGKKKKSPFCHLFIYKKVIIDAIRRRHSLASEEEVQILVSTYLSQTKTRMGGTQPILGRSVTLEH